MDADDHPIHGPWITLAEASVPCFLCAETAGVVAVHRSGPAFQVVRRSFTGKLTRPVKADLAHRVTDALAGGAPAERLFILDAEFAPFYCPQCRTSFCGLHWAVDVVHDDDFENWVDSLRGRCPFDHERMLED